MAAAGKLYDMIRLDHFRGFEAYWAVPYGDTTARGGRWIKGPGKKFIDAIQQHLPQVRLIAEDLGFLTQEVLDLRDGAGLPGMKILEFAFCATEPSEYLPYKYERNSVCYIGTHDNMTMRQWFETAYEDDLAFAIEYMKLSKEEGYVWGVIRTALSSVSDLCVVQMQDYLDLGDEARMNFPGTMTDANWTWRAKDGMITDELAKKICRLTRVYGRINK
jgi:4-alpha-glucanotransferase